MQFYPGCVKYKGLYFHLPAYTCSVFCEPSVGLDAIQRTYVHLQT